MARPVASQPDVEVYVAEVVQRFPDKALEVLLAWARHDPEVARALDLNFLDLVAPVTEEVKARARTIIAAAQSPGSPSVILESEERIRAREEFIRNFIP